MYCPNCGFPANDNQRFCSNCGEPLPESASQRPEFDDETVPLAGATVPLEDATVPLEDAAGAGGADSSGAAPTGWSSLAAAVSGSTVPMPDVASDGEPAGAYAAATDGYATAGEPAASGMAPVTFDPEEPSPKNSNAPIIITVCCAAVVLAVLIAVFTLMP